MRSQVASSLTSWERTATGCRARFRFPGDLPVFAGHFPGQPLVPGVFLIEAVRLAAERRTGQPLWISQVVVARFSAPVPPDLELGLELSLELEAGHFRCRAEARIGAVVAGKFTLELAGTLDSSDPSI